MSFDFIASHLRERKQKHLHRTAKVVQSNHEGIIGVDERHYINFASNDYLGLSQHQDVLQAYVEGLSLYGASSSASPLVTGLSAEHQQLQELIAQVTGQQAAMLFSSGFAANTAICQALAKPAPNVHNELQIFSDKLMHASFVEAAANSSVPFKRFKHNDAQHLATLLNKHQSNSQNSLIATEGVFSMDGDTPDFPQLATVVKQHSANWMMDEAHSFGVCGNNFFGFSGELPSDMRPQITMGTFGKAVGTSGAFVAGSSELIDYLTNFSKHYIYSTSPAPATMRATIKSLEVISTGEYQAKLHANIDRFLNGLKTLGFAETGSTSAIQPIIIGSPDKALAMQHALQDLSLYCTAIRTPTVPQGEDRLRITISAIHGEKDIDALLSGLEIARDKTAVFDGEVKDSPPTDVKGDYL